MAGARALVPASPGRARRDEQLTFAELLEHADEGGPIEIPDASKKAAKKHVSQSESSSAYLIKGRGLPRAKKAANLGKLKFAQRVSGKRKPRCLKTPETLAENVAPANKCAKVTSDPAVRAGAGILPRDLAVEACVTLPEPWSLGQVLPIPEVISLRELLSEKERGSVDREERPSVANEPTSVPEGEGSASDQAVAAPPVPDALASIGKRDVLGEVIRSMENRLARQGLLAAPGTILSRQKKVKKRSVEEFYDADDGFIDDGDLEDVNDDDDGPTIGGDENLGQNGSASLSLGDALKAAVPQDHGDFRRRGRRQRLDPVRFRLAGMEFSASSEDDSCSNTESSDDETKSKTKALRELVSGTRGWRERIEDMAEELKWVPLQAIDCAQQDDGHAVQEVSDVLSVLQPALTSCCSSIETVSGQGDGDAMVDVLVTQLRALWRQIPLLVRPQGHRGRWSLSRFEGACAFPSHVALDCWHGDAFGWVVAEEVAWSYFLRRLCQSACGARRLSRSAFVRAWFEASREPQLAALVHAESAALKLASSAEQPSASPEPDSGCAESSNGAISAGADAATPKELPLATRKMIDALRGCYARERFWGEQRRLSRLRVPWRGDDAPELSLAIYVTTKIKALVAVGISDVKAYLGIASHQQRPAPQETPGKTKSHIFPIKLPVRMSCVIPGAGRENQCIMLNQVFSMDRQLITIGTVRHLQRFDSLDDAAHFLMSGRKTRGSSDDYRACPPRIRALLMARYGGWDLFNIKYGQHQRSIFTMMLTAQKLDCNLFENPDGSPPYHLDVDALAAAMPSSYYRKAKMRQYFLRNLTPDSWVSCREGPSGRGGGDPGRIYNAKIVRAHIGADSGKPSSYDIVWSNGVVEKGVDKHRVLALHVWKPGEEVSIYDRGHYWRGVVEGVNDEHADPEELVFAVRLGERRLQAGLAMLRQWYPPQTGASAPGAAPSRAGAAAARRGGRGSSKASTARPLVSPNTAVLFRTRESSKVWCRGKVHRDLGEFIEVSSCDGVTKLKRDLVRFMTSSGKNSGGSSSAAAGSVAASQQLIRVEDSD
eukprot:TRINITY_DN1560_c0_g2_i1.p1 TRINITY_DN1560_c0_g2~~TRINITY_DN1560_c0_g2_i1.p1  ORF type:complete len:1058 (+),score=171.69 TRINITY_DN1560_c0_g2_i1:148-3321(+)